MKIIKFPEIYIEEDNSNEEDEKIEKTLIPELNNVTHEEKRRLYFLGFAKKIQKEGVFIPFRDENNDIIGKQRVISERQKLLYKKEYYIHLKNARLNRNFLNYIKYTKSINDLKKVLKEIELIPTFPNINVEDDDSLEYILMELGESIKQIPEAFYEEPKKKGLR